MVHTLLTKQGYRAVAADGAEAALRELCAATFDLALVDYMMPGTDVLALLDRLQRLPDPPPCVMMTAFGSVETVIAAMRAGAVDFMAKPFAPEELLHVVRRNMRTQSL